MSFVQNITPNLNDNTLLVYFNVIGQGWPLNDWYGDCLAVTRNALGIKDPIGSSAWDCYENYNQFNHGDRNWPVGVYFLVWFSGYGGLGHVAIAYINPTTGVMTIWTSPYTHKAYFDRYNDVDRLAKGYGVTYAGWSEDMGGIRVISPQANQSQGDNGVAIIEDADNWKNRAQRSFQTIRGRAMGDGEFAPFVGQDFLHMVEALEDNPEADQHMANANVGAQALAENWQGQITQYQQTAAQLNDTITSITADDTATKAELQDALSKVATLTTELKTATDKATNSPTPIKTVVPDPATYYSFSQLFKAIVLNRVNWFKKK